MSCAQDATTPTAFSERESLTAIRRRGGMRGHRIKYSPANTPAEEQHRQGSPQEARLED